MKAYVAAPFGRKVEARAAIQTLAALGIESTARWVESHYDDETKPEILRLEAMEDLNDIDRADMLVLLASWPREGSGGKDVELGYALGRGKKVVVVGEPYSLFHYYPCVKVVASVGEIVS